ncbi:baseplate J/gp47 family protein [Pseudomonas oryzihabitans]|uniref:baseplate J/gp47 family protein n=1 Tax=Pseudomonas oryzihabitans TaxID=47885 RepID=UPI00289F85FE|nr:baseplate J/gp47 family protein [Pseudomonas oryzihabitans]
MALTVPTFDAILSGILRDIRNLNAEADIGADSDNYVRAASFAAAMEGFYQKLAWLYAQIFPDTAGDDEVIREAALRGLVRKNAVAATGSIKITGAADVALLAGSALTHVASGAVFVTLASTNLSPAGEQTVKVQAQVAGTAGNGLTGALRLVSPPLGMDSGATFTASPVGGEDRESVASLLARLLDLMQSPPAGGADYDYARWAKEVDGVADALVLPLRRGGGSVDIAITGATGVPSVEVVANCQAHIDSLCSVYSDVLVFVPTIRTVNASASVELLPGYVLADVQAAGQRAYNDLLGALKPREGLRRSQIEAMISNLAGVADRSVTTPSGNVAASADASLIGWIRPGILTLSLLA